MDNNLSNVNSEQNLLSVTNLDQAEVKEFEKNDKVSPSFSEILGKSEQTLKQEFYCYKVKELMQKVGLIIEDKATQIEIQEDMEQAYNLGIKDFLVTPFYYSVVKGLNLKYRKGISLSVAVDYPLGEEEFKGKVAGVKEACKNGADYVMCVLPEKAIKLACFMQEKRKIAKCGRVSKKPFGVIAKASLEESELQRILKNTDCIKSDSIVIEGYGEDVYKLKDSIRTAISFKGNRKLFVITSVDTVEKLTLIMDGKIDKMFTPHANRIAQELNKIATLQS